MVWELDAPFQPRPVVVIEDHLYHVEEILTGLGDSAGELTGQLTILCLDQPGPDTERTVRRWLSDHENLQVAFQTRNPDRLESDPLATRILPLPPALFQNANRFCKTVASLIRPGGLMVQDIQLATLQFLSAEQWWESIYLANTVRGMFPQSPPRCRFMSNKSGFHISFGKELMDAGFDPREVIDKHELAALILPVINRFLNEEFPLLLTWEPGPNLRLRCHAEDRQWVASHLDLVLWLDREEFGSLLGQAVKPKGKEGFPSFKRDSHEGTTWIQLMEDRLGPATGLPVVSIGGRLAPEGSLKAEQTNIAARHLHTLRSRLQGRHSIVTKDHAYHLDRQLRVGRVTRIH